MKKLFHISPDTLSTASEQILALRIGERHCCFAIANNSGKKLYELAYYSTNEMDENSLINLLVIHPELNNAFSKVVVCYDSPQTVLVPEKYFNLEEANKMLKALYALNDQSNVATQSVPEYHLNNIYAIPKEINDWVNRKFSSATYFHNYIVGIQNINANGNIRADFRTDEFSLIATNENNLLLAQTFSYANPEDVLYYLLKVTQQFSFSQKEIKLIVTGLIEKESALFKELYHYFLNIEFRNADWESADEFPKHFFTSLNDLIRCAS